MRPRVHGDWISVILRPELAGAASQFAGRRGQLMLDGQLVEHLTQAWLLPDGVRLSFQGRDQQVLGEAATAGSSSSISKTARSPRQPWRRKINGANSRRTRSARARPFP